MTDTFLKIKDELTSLKNLGTLQGQHRVMWKDNGVCYGTSWTMSIGAITEDDVYEMDEDKPEVQAFMNMKDYDYMTVAQPKYCMLCARKNMSVEVSLEDMAQIIGGKVIVTPCEEEPITSALKAVPATLISELEMAITLGRDIYESFVAMMVLEKASEVQYKSAALGGLKTLTEKQILLQRGDYLKKYSDIRVKHKAALPKGADKNETHLRESLCEAGRDLVKEGLIHGIWGSLSVRLDRDYMLVTPLGLSHDSLVPEDIVKVKLSNLSHSENENEPTSDTLIHKNIYSKRADVNAIIHTHSTMASLYAAARMPLEIIAKDGTEEIIRCTKYEANGSTKSAKRAAEELKDRRGVILANHGMITVGDTLKIAVENAKSIELAATEAIDARRDTLDLEVYIGK